MHAAVALTHTPPSVCLRIAGTLGPADHDDLCARFADVLCYLECDTRGSRGTVELDLRGLESIDEGSMHLLGLFRCEAVAQGRSLDVVPPAHLKSIAVTHVVTGEPPGAGTARPRRPEAPPSLTQRDGRASSPRRGGR